MTDCSKKNHGRFVCAAKAKTNAIKENYMNAFFKTTIAATMLAAAMGGGGRAAEPATRDASPTASARASEDKLMQQIRKTNARDTGIETVCREQNSSVVVPTGEQDAMGALEDYARRKQYRIEWDENNGRLFVTAQYEFNSPDPAFDRDFLQKREHAVQMAVLLAKGKIINFINSEISAEQRMTIPGTDAYRVLNAEYELVRENIMARQAALASLLREVDAAEARLLTTETMGERLYAAMERAFTVVEKALGSGALGRERQYEYIKAKSAYDAARGELTALVEKAENMKKKTLLEFENKIAVYSKMTLVGATVVQQAESWNAETGNCQVAVLMCWSRGLERAARAIFVADPYREDRDGGGTVGEWLDRHDLGAMVGPRQFLDENGQRFFVGISAWPAYTDSHMNRDSRDQAAINARQMAVFALLADTESAEESASLLRGEATGSLDVSSEDSVASALKKHLEAKFKKGSVKGLMPLRERQVRHPISGKLVNVAVYGISPRAAAMAVKMEQDIIESEKHFDTAQAVWAEQTAEAKREIAENRALGAAAPGAEAMRGLGKAQAAATVAEAAQTMEPAAVAEEPVAWEVWPPYKTCSAVVMSGGYHEDP